MSMNVNLNYSAFFSITKKPDAEWQMIISRLWNVYGVRSTGNKALDKQILHEYEVRDAQNNTEVSEEFLTVSESEKGKIKENKDIKKAENEPEKQEITDGAKFLGEQIFLAIRMKDEQDNFDYKKKRDNKYQS